MADEETKYLLNTWGVPELMEIFQENLIDITTLRLLNEEDLDKFIHPMGLRVRFRENWKLWSENLNKAQSADRDNIFVEELPVLVDISNRIIAGTHHLQEKEHTTHQEASETDVATRTVESRPHSLITSSTLLREDQGVLTSPSPCSDIGVTLPSDFVVNVLNGSLDGRAITAAGRQNNWLLKEAQRKELARLVIKHILDKDPMQKIQSVTFTRLALQIISIFPKESASLYFTSSLAATKYQRKKNASGVLYEAYISRRRKLRDLGELPRGTVRSRSSSASSTKPASPLPSTSSTPDATAAELENPILEEHFKWLANSVEPWVRVELYWKETADIRLKQIEVERTSIAEYFSRFPALKLHQGYKLLQEDFSLLYPGTENHLFSNVILFQELLLKLARERRDKSRDPEYKRQLDIYLAAASAEPKNNSVATLLLLPYLLNVPPAIRKPGKPVWKPSRSEVRDAFITQVPTEADILPTLEARKNKYRQLGRYFQPLIIIVGQTLDETNKFHVVIDDTIYDFTSAIGAVDGAFKIFHATGACYPEEAIDVWLLIQLAFYKIKTKYDRLSQAIRHLLTDLGQAS